jgi:Ser/Thr protein kinase RdoA (MazF antagonist)
MNDFATLTRRGKALRLRRLVQTILPAYPWANPQLTYLGHGFNTTFCVREEEGAPNAPSAPHDPSRYLLRVHRPGWHGTVEETHAAVQSEMRWLNALNHDTDLVVPLPFATNAGVYTVAGSTAGIPEAHVCSALGWVNGRFQAHAPKPVHFYRVGVLTAQLHNHAAAWPIPDDFVRDAWDWDALFGGKISFPGLSAQEIWALVPDPQRGVLEDAALLLHAVMDELGTSPEAWGLIHSDLHLENVLFAGDAARPIDFDDCGFGHWIYDMAVTLWEWCSHQEWPAFCQAYLDGYTQHRPLPQEQLHQLNAYMAGREASIGLAIVARTVEVPEYRQYLAEDMEDVAQTIRAIQAVKDH